MEKCLDEQKFILRFIENYQNLPALWNVKLEAYSNRDEKKKQYAILLEIYKEQYRNATVDDVKKKINLLRTNYRREKQRLAECNKSGAGAEDSLESYLFYYDEMQFLDDVEKPCTSKSTTTPFKESTSKAAKWKPDPADGLVEIATKKFLSNDKKKSDPITESWALKLERMTTEQRILCEKFVEDLMFEGQMGTLHRNSVKINCDNDYPTADTFRGSSSNLAHAYTGSNSIQSEEHFTNSPIQHFFSSFSD